MPFFALALCFTTFLLGHGQKSKFAELEYGCCQFWSKVTMSEMKQRPRLIMGGYGQHRHQWVNKQQLIQSIVSLKLYSKMPSSLISVMKQSTLLTQMPSFSGILSLLWPLLNILLLLFLSWFHSSGSFNATRFCVIFLQILRTRERKVVKCLPL